MCSVNPNWDAFNPVLFRVCRVCSFLCCAKLKQTAESCILFFWLILQKSKDLFLLWMYTKKSKPFTSPIIFMTKRSSCFHCKKGKKIKWLLQCRMCSHLSILACSFIIIKNNQSNIWKKHIAPFKYLVQSVLLSVITVPPWSYAKHFVLHGYCNASEVGVHKR